MNILDHLNLGRRHRLPAILATEAAECGLACMAMIARYHGHDVDLNGLRQRFSLSLAGASLRSLMGIADQLGFSTRALRAEIGGLGKVHLPVILHWDLNHFVVLKSIGRKTATIHDPAAGVRTMSLDQFSKHFTGVVLELARAEGFEPITEKAPMKLSFLWSRIRGSGSALLQVLILSAALQIATFAAPFQLQLVVDEALAQQDRELLLVIALAFGGLIIVQAAIEGFRGLGPASVRPSPELSDHRQSRSPSAPAAERLFREAARGRHHVPARLRQADPGRHHPGRGQHRDRRRHGLHRSLHPVLLFDHARADRHSGCCPQPVDLARSVSRA